VIYGLYLSAGGVLASSHRQDVIANNLANSQTAGFKRDLAMFRQERTEAQLRGLNPGRHSSELLEALGGGLNHGPTAIDHAQGPIEPTGSPLDVAIHGGGYLAVRDAKGATRLTRDGKLSVTRDGYLVTAAGGHQVLDERLNAVQLGKGQLAIGKDGQITQNGQPVTKLALFDVPDARGLRKLGHSLMTYPNLERNLRPATGQLQQGFIENANSEPATELAALMEAQRQLEANANMIRFQDQTLSRLVNDVGKIG
jgi:flagellar basal body rod protein FlgG